MQVLEPVGLDKFKKDNLVEIPPEVDDQGEFTEVQVLEEFDPDKFLNQLKPQDSICPRCTLPYVRGTMQRGQRESWGFSWFRN